MLCLPLTQATRILDVPAAVYFVANRVYAAVPQAHAHGCIAVGNETEAGEGRNVRIGNVWPVCRIRGLRILGDVETNFAGREVIDHAWTYHPIVGEGKLRDASGCKVAGQGIPERRPLVRQCRRGTRTEAAAYAVVGKTLINPEEQSVCLL